MILYYYFIFLVVGLLGTFALLPFYVIAKKADAEGRIPRQIEDVVYFLLLIAGILDIFLLNPTASLILWDRPFQCVDGHWEITFSQHLKRLIKLDGYTGNLARWTAETFIYWIDPEHLK